MWLSSSNARVRQSACAALAELLSIRTSADKSSNKAAAGVLLFAREIENCEMLLLGDTGPLSYSFAD